MKWDYNAQVWYLPKDSQRFQDAKSRAKRIGIVLGRHDFVRLCQKEILDLKTSIEEHGLAKGHALFGINRSNKRRQAIEAMKVGMVPYAEQAPKEGFQSPNYADMEARIVFDENEKLKARIKELETRSKDPDAFAKLLLDHSKLKADNAALQARVEYLEGHVEVLKSELAERGAAHKAEPIKRGPTIYCQNDEEGGY
jgi:hypothetical protein